MLCAKFGCSGVEVENVNSLEKDGQTDGQTDRQTPDDMRSESSFLLSAQVS